MKTTEEMLNRKLCKDYLTDGQWKAIIETMEEYAEQQVKNLNIPAVINQRELLISFYQWYHEVHYKDERLEKIIDTFLFKRNQ